MPVAREEGEGGRRIVKDNWMSVHLQLATTQVCSLSENN